MTASGRRDHARERRRWARSGNVYGLPLGSLVPVSIVGSASGFIRIPGRLVVALSTGERAGHGVGLMGYNGQQSADRAVRDSPFPFILPDGINGKSVPSGEGDVPVDVEIGGQALLTLSL